jgi:hypothetical protein
MAEADERKPAEADPDANAGALAGTEADEEYEPTPWHFKLLVLGLVLYLVYRGVQLVMWLVDKI